MSNPFFSFKQFTIYHDKCAMKVGSDGVLLGVWAAVGNSKSILDIGTGSGLIALMLAQRSEAVIDAIDIDNDAIVQAKENIDNSPWSSQVNAINTSLHDFASVNDKKYDLIVSNPPFFVNSLKAPLENRSVARHTHSLSHTDLLASSVKMLHASGRICMILPVIEGEICIESARRIGLYCSKKVVVYPKPEAVAKRLLLEFIMQDVQPEISQLIIESDVRHQYSAEFSVLAKDYYLKL